MKQPRNRVSISTYILMLSVVGTIDLIRSVLTLALSVTGLAVSTSGTALSFIPIIGVAAGLVQQSTGIAIWMASISINIMFSILQFVTTTLWWHFIGVSMFERGMLSKFARTIGLGFIPLSGVISTYFTLKHIEAQDREYNEREANPS